MVFSSTVIVSVANTSAEIWQRIACPPEERVSSQQLMDLICCFPLHQFERFARCLWIFFCLPPPTDSYYSYYDSDSSSSSDYDDDDDDGRHNNYYYDSHSD